MTSSLQELDATLQELHARKDAWVAVEIPQRILYLRQCLEGTEQVAADWVRAACQAKGIDFGSPLAGEEWLSGPMATVRNIRLLMESLQQGAQPKPSRLKQRPDGQWVARVFPQTVLDRLLFQGFTADVWLQPEKEAKQGVIYRRKDPAHLPPGKIALVLGAGNVASIGPLDVLYKLFVEDQVVILKMNPVNQYLGPFIEKAFAPLVKDGFLRFAYGGAEVGQFLTDHEKVEAIHLTGSDKTHDAIVWGVGEEGEARRRSGDRRLNKEISAELGCVTPVLITPGQWRPSELAFQAQHVASMVAHNASFNCNAAKVLVTAKGWPQRREFMDKVRKALADAGSRMAYYPGAEQRYQGFLDQYPQAQAVGQSGEKVVPWTLIEDVPAKHGEYALTNEAFCGVLAEIAVDASEPGDFLNKAVAFANESIWGTLSCCLLIPPAVEKANKAAFSQAVANLRYGGIGVNVWPGVIYALGCTTWGAFPGHTADDIQSGTGVVHNTLLFDDPEKSVLKAPFKIFPKPVWFANHRTLDQVGRKMIRMEAEPSLAKLPGLVWAAIRG
ncbi:MAG: NAD-dependent aldehyde dehydrogenase [Planctomycetota bacterium]|nr:MAG: NAD-dependent aldehyde dehydrogenase [Planctomycetota bacterium]